MALLALLSLLIKQQRFDFGEVLSEAAQETK